MTIGLQFKNDSGDILIDSDYHHFHFVGIATYTGTVRLPALLGGNNTKHSYTGTTGLSGTQTNGDIIKYTITTASGSSVPPIVFIKPSYTGANAPFCGLVLTQQINTTTWEFWVLQDHGYNRPSLYCFNKFTQMTTSQQTVPSTINQGIATYNSSGQKTYDTRFKPLKVVGTSNTTAPSLARPSVASNYNPDFTPTNRTNITLAPSSGDVSDLMFYAPSLAHSCQSTTASKSGDGFQSAGYNSYFYAWARLDLWWCFYRNTFRLTSATQMQSAYSIYASGHVYKSQEDKSSIFTITNILVAIFTFGAGLLVTLGAIALSIAVTASFADAGVVSGVYFPYENSSRNANQTHPVILSRASYYGLEEGVTYTDTNVYASPSIIEADPDFFDTLTWEFSQTSGNETYCLVAPYGVLGPNSPPLIQIYYQGTYTGAAILSNSTPETAYYDNPYLDFDNYRYYIDTREQAATQNNEIVYYRISRVAL